jgi:hypothetical protein
LGCKENPLRLPFPTSTVGFRPNLRDLGKLVALATCKNVCQMPRNVARTTVDNL